MKIQMKLVSEGKLIVSKVVDSEYKADIFERDMPAKYNIAFTKIPHYIQRTYLDRI